MFQYKNNILCCEEIPLKQLEDTFDTPLYVYSKAKLDENIQILRGAFSKYCSDGLICYAVKANSHLSLLNYLSIQGFGFDIVSHGELLRVLKVQGHLNNVVYSGSAKTESDIYDAVKNDLFMLNAESFWELEQASSAGREFNKIAHVALRVNPSVDPKTHKNISTGVKGAKFGIPHQDLISIAKKVAELPHVQIKGLSCHIGSMVSGEQPFLQMLDVMVDLAEKLQKEGIPLEFIDLGGGFPITYTDEKILNYDTLFALYQAKISGLGLKVIIEPGRSLIGTIAILLTRVVHIKESYGQKFAFLDAGFTELIRPALYDATHRILPVCLKGDADTYTIVGPICESTDVFATDINIAVEEGSLLVIENAGAYGMVMASNYNTRPKCAEVLIDGDKIHVLTQRQSYEQLWENEQQLVFNKR